MTDHLRPPLGLTTMREAREESHQRLKFAYHVTRRQGPSQGAHSAGPNIVRTLRLYISLKCFGSRSLRTHTGKVYHQAGS